MSLNEKVELRALRQIKPIQGTELFWPCTVENVSNTHINKFRQPMPVKLHFRSLVFAVATLISATQLNADTTAPSPKIKKQKPADATRNPANVIFDKTGVLVGWADALPIDHYGERLKHAGVKWIALQIDNGGNKRDDNIAAMEHGWADAWRKAGFKVGFWGCPRGVGKHGEQSAVDTAIPNVQADAALGANLTAKLHGEFYIADCEDGYQSYGPKDPTPALNKVYVDAFTKAAAAAGISKLPRALSSEGRIALDMQPWIQAGWDAMPQAYWNAYAVYQPSKCVDFYVQETGWPIDRIHPTIATFTSEGEHRNVSLEQYAADLSTRNTTGFSFYLPESYLKSDDHLYEQLAAMSSHRQH